MMTDRTHAKQSAQLPHPPGGATPSLKKFSTFPHSFPHSFPHPITGSIA